MSTGVERSQTNDQSVSTSNRQSASLRRPPVWDEESRLVPTNSRYNAASALACLLFVATLAGVAGPVGAVAGLLTGVVWYLLGSPYAVAAGTVLAVSAVSVPASPLVATFIGLPLLMLVLAPVASTLYRGGFVAVVLVSTGVLAVSVWLLADLLATWLVAMASLLGVGVGVYAGHRYLLVTLGVVSTGTDRETSADTQ
ncbi:hypothetical protein SAMN05216226_11915 [Halovenus aranensis]|uniref:DUF8163 domain-containing protein n=1 Tax=Halovenus aranensis TaxID=890420 RepID=A0A1G8ZB58_9EURY|nr:hypothetical protein [Halovenus aranensis]SDK11390.1 hypothetical protein SAMN05216226_11915 [Halovenus aranensis]